MVYNDIKRILPRFNFSGTYTDATEMTSGNINSTYRLEYAHHGKPVFYTLQRINHYVFKNPYQVMENIEKVTKHLQASYEAEGVDSTRRVLRLISTVDGGTLFQDEAGNYWRAYHYISDVTPYDSPEKPIHLYETGRIFGEFQKRLYDFPADQLFETIPNFHNTTRRFYDFVASVAADKAGRVKEVEDEIEFMFEHRRMMNGIVHRLETGELPLRVTHNDTKINNVLIDNATDKAVCVIDLDTVMPGSSLYDFGDAIRFGASTAAEDEPDTSKISLDLDLYRLFTEGFLSEVNGFLTPEEIRLFPLGAKVLTCELAMRFLTDYIDGDLYFKVRSPKHNLVRARAQMALLTDMEKKSEQMDAIIEEAMAK